MLDNDNFNGGPLSQNFDNAGKNLINDNENPVPNKTLSSSTEYDKSNNKIMKFPVKKFDGVTIKNLTKNPQKCVLKENIDGTPIDYILGCMDLNKEKTYLTLNRRLRQLANEIPQEVSNYENDKQVFYRDKLSKNKILKFMPVSFDRLITLIQDTLARIEDQFMKASFQNCLNQYTQQVKDVSQNFDNILNNIKINSGDIADKLGDSATIHQLLEKQASDLYEWNKGLLDYNPEIGASNYAQQLIAIKADYNSYCDAINQFNQNINGPNFNNGSSIISLFVHDLLSLSQQWWGFQNQGKSSLYQNVCNVVSKLQDNSLTQKWNSFSNLISYDNWFSLTPENWRIVSDFWDEFYKLTKRFVGCLEADTRNCLECLVNIYKNSFLLQYNAAALQYLANNIQTSDTDRLNSDLNELEKLHDREVLLKQKRNATFDISQTIRFYFKNYSENNNNELNEIYEGMLFDGCNGWVPGFYENSRYIEGFLLLWNPIDNSTIKITEDELKNCKFPTVGTENPSGKCFANAINAIFVHVPAFYLYFKKLGEQLVSLRTGNINNGQLNEIKKKFPFAYETAMYVYSLANPGNQKWVPMGNFYDTLGKLDEGFSTYAASTNRYLDFLIQRLDQELKVSCHVGSKVDVDRKYTPEVNYLHCFHNSKVNICKLDSSPIQKLLNAKTIVVTHHDACNNYSMSLPYNNIQTPGKIILNLMDQSEKQKYSDEISLEHMLAIKNTYDMPAGIKCFVCNKAIQTTNAGARCLFDQNSTIVPLIIDRGKGACILSSGDNSQNDIRTKVPFYVKSGNSYFELVSVEVFAGNSGQSGHLYSLVKNPKTDVWYKFNDAFGGSPANLDELQNAIESTGYIYLYHKCSEKKYNDHKNKDFCEDISKVSFDPDNLGITKSPLYLNDTNGDLQTNKVNSLDLAIDSLKKHWQDPAMGILDANGNLLNEKNSSMMINDDLNNKFYNADRYKAKALFVSVQTKNFNPWFLLSSIVLFAIAILSAILLTSPFHPLSIVFFMVGSFFLFPSFKYRCFSYYLKKCFACCLPIGYGLSKYKNEQSKNKNNKYPHTEYDSKYMIK